MSFKHFFSTHLTESEFKANFKTINESRWWGKFKEDATSLLEIKTTEGKIKKYKVCKLDEDGNGPAYVLEARGGARYGLFRATENKFHCIRMKSGKKNLIKTKEGAFREVDGKLVFELFTLKPDPNTGKGAVRVGGGPDLVKQAVNKRAKKPADPDWANKTMGPVAPRVRVGDGMGKPAAPAPKFDPNATLREESNEEVELAISKYLTDVCQFTPKQLRNWWTITDREDIGCLWDEKVKPWLAASASTPISEDDTECTVCNKAPCSCKKVTERRATAEPDKSMPNGEPTFDKNTDEWNKGVYTDAKA